MSVCVCVSVYECVWLSVWLSVYVWVCVTECVCNSYTMLTIDYLLQILYDDQNSILYTHSLLARSLISFLLIPLTRLSRFVLPGLQQESREGPTWERVLGQSFSGTPNQWWLLSRNSKICGNLSSTKQKLTILTSQIAIVNISNAHQQTSVTRTETRNDFIYDIQFIGKFTKFYELFISALLLLDWWERRDLGMPQHGRSDSKEERQVSRCVSECEWVREWVNEWVWVREWVSAHHDGKPKSFFRISDVDTQWSAVTCLTQTTHTLTLYPSVRTALLQCSSAVNVVHQKQHLKQIEENIYYYHCHHHYYHHPTITTITITTITIPLSLYTITIPLSLLSPSHYHYIPSPSHYHYYHHPTITISHHLSPSHYHYYHHPTTH